MGSSFYTVEEAASRLNRCKRSIWDYINKGLIKKELRSGKVVLPVDDVEQLALSLGTDYPALTRQTYFLMQARLKKLEEEMVTVKTILEIRVDPLRLDNIAARGMFEASKHYLAATGTKDFVISEENVDHWADIFIRVDEETLDSLVKANLEPTAWKPFYEWCLVLLNYSTLQDQVKPSIVWQARAQKLDQGRKKIRDAIIFWVESGRGTTSAMVADILDSPKEALVRRLGGKN